MNHVRIVADDYGLSSSVNRGIEELASASKLDGVSIMAHRDADLTTLHKLRGAPVELGVHLVLVEERPLVPLPGHNGPDARLPSDYRSLFVALTRKPALASYLAEEASAQIAALRALGLPLRFVNSHQHVHMFPLLWRALRPVLEREGLRVRVARHLRWSPPKQWLVELASVVSWRLWPLRACETSAPIGIESAGHFDRAAAARLAARLRSSTCQSVELVVHPGHEDEALHSRYGHWGYRWAEEYRTLAGSHFRRSLESAGAA